MTLRWSSTNTEALLGFMLRTNGKMAEGVQPRRGLPQPLGLTIAWLVDWIRKHALGQRCIAHLSARTAKPIINSHAGSALREQCELLASVSLSHVVIAFIVVRVLRDGGC